MRKVTFIVAECSEFHDFGELYEDISSVEEAIEIYRKIDHSRINGVPAIGVKLHTPGDEPFMDDELDILVGESIDEFSINHCSAFRENPIVQKALTVLRQEFSQEEAH